MFLYGKVMNATIFHYAFHGESYELTLSFHNKQQESYSVDVNISL